MSGAGWKEQNLSREQQREQKRMAVLKTGAKLFNDRGFDRTTLDDIAEALNVSKRTLYYYVKNKDDILFECNRLAYEFMYDAQEAAKDESIPVLERIEGLLRGYLRNLDTDFGACLVLSKQNLLSEESAAYLKEGRRRLDHSIRDLIQTGIDQGVIPPCEPRYAAATIFGALNWVPHWYRGNEKIDIEELADHMVPMLMAGLAAGSAKNS